MAWFAGMLLQRWSPFRRNRVRKVAAEEQTAEFSSMHDLACTSTAVQHRFAQRGARRTVPTPRQNSNSGEDEAEDQSDRESIASSVDYNDPQVRARCETLLFIPDAEEYMDPEKIRRYRAECRRR
eukprot:TRINITY_DN5244_c1_g1_i1.p2 TRINITY_DN5244_c1_g1~~TRINITY_DN5244_c1_g1_i1.p2  ORF type:complete len:125 (-),score=20.43 TRINITY_DN5244_c1_g1_i1:279-653(-)